MADFTTKLKTLEDRTKQGFSKVKSDFKVLTESIAATQKDTDAEQDKVLDQIKKQVEELAVARAVDDNEASAAAATAEVAVVDKPGVVSEEMVTDVTKKMTTLEERTKQGFTKVKTDFKALTESLAATQKETDAA